MSSLKRKAAGPADGPDAKKPMQNSSITSFFGAPKTANGSGGKSSQASVGSDAPEPAGPKFDKKKWVAGLSSEQRELLQLEIDTMHESWLALLKDDLTSKEFLELKRFLAKETAAGKKWFPPKEDVYSWSRYTPFNSVKVVILGQDPYHNHNQAHGLAFSVKPPTPAPPSLKNMFIGLRNDYPAFRAPPKNGGLLTPWAERGVLLLNACLTVRAHEANSHAGRGWERLTQRVVDLVAARRPRGVVFLAWGTPAGKRVARVDGARHCVLRSVHPSPLSAARGFFDCGHFRKANEWLVKRYGPEGEVNWALVEGDSTLSSAGAGGAAGLAAKAADAGAKKKAEKPAAAAAKNGADEIDDDLDAEMAAAAAELEAEAEAAAKKGPSAA